MCYTKFLRVLCASDTCLALTEEEVEMREHAVQSNPVSERSKAFDPNINFMSCKMFVFLFQHACFFVETIITKGRNAIH